MSGCAARGRTRLRGLHLGGTHRRGRGSLNLSRSTDGWLRRRRGRVLVVSENDVDAMIATQAKQLFDRILARLSEFSGGRHVDGMGAKMLGHGICSGERQRSIEPLGPGAARIARRRDPSCAPALERPYNGIQRFLRAGREFG